MKNRKFKIDLARNIGFCFGVRRTVGMAESILDQGQPLSSIGDIVHNPDVMANLRHRGLKVVKDCRSLRTGGFIIRSHGLAPAVVEEIRKKGLVIHDATCPYVRKLQGLVERLDRQGFSIIIIGDSRHPEVQALLGYGRSIQVLAPGRGLTRQVPAVLGSRPDAKIAVVGQTTLSSEEYSRTVKQLAAGLDRPAVKIFNTICQVTQHRQKEARDLSRRADGVLVLGGRKSANTRKLYQVCRAENSRTFLIESLQELRKLSLPGGARIGLTSGTSTSRQFIRQVVNYLKKA